MKRHNVRVKILDILWVAFLVLSIVMAPFTKYSHYLMTGFIVVATAFAERKNALSIRRVSLAIYAYFALFFGYMIISVLWADAGVSKNISMIISFIECLVVIVCAGAYMHSRSRILRFLKIYITSVVILAVLYYATSPVSTWGTEGMGRVLNIWRNSAGYYFGFGAIFAAVIYMYGGKNKTIMAAGLFLALAAVATGSRKVFLQFGMALLTFWLLQPNLKQKMRYFVWGGIAVVAAVIIGINIPAIRDMYAGRILEVFKGAQSSDSSTVVRALMRENAITLFLENPILGIGLDGFRTWMGDQSAFLDRWAIDATYSHCNYTELLANNGLIGFLLFYFYPVKLIMRNWRYKSDAFVKLGIITLTTFIVLDYGTVSYATKMCLYILMVGIVLVNVHKVKD